MNQNLKDKMLNYQVAPPENLWNSIAFELDKEEVSAIAYKLNSYEIPAPSFVWSKIEEELDKESGRVIELKSRNKVFTIGRIAAAASIALILSTSIWFFTQNQKPQVDSVTTNTPKNTTNDNSTSVTPITTTDDKSELASDIQEKNKKGNTEVKVTNNKEKQIEIGEEMVTTTPSQDLTKNPFENKEEKLVNQQGETPENIDLVSTPNSYLTIVGPNGQSVRISSKFSKQVGLFTEKDPDKMENIDFIIEESAKWRNKINKWRNKMNSLDVSPSLSNFLDIIELSKQIDTDKKK